MPSIPNRRLRPIGNVVDYAGTFIPLEHAMQIDTRCARLALANQRTLRLRDALGATLQPVRGTLWITIDGDPRDIVLEAGESFVVDVDRPMVVAALGGCAQFDLRGLSAASARSAPPPPWPARSLRPDGRERIAG
jgi:hypothetical protein